MKVTVERDVLKACLGRLRTVKSEIPILANVLLSAGPEHRLTARTHGLDFCCEASCGAECAEAGAVTVKLADLAGLISLAPSGSQVMIAGDADQISIRFGHSRYRLGTLPASDFPNPLKCEAQDRLDLTADEARRLFDEPTPTMGDEKSPKAFSKGIFLHTTTAGRIGSCATTGLQLIRAEVNLEAKIRNPIIIPHDVVRDIVRAAKAGPLRLEWSENALQIVSGDSIITTKLIDAAYPDYESTLLAGSDDSHLKIVRADLVDALSRLCLVAPEKGVVIFEWDVGAPALRLSFETGDFASEEIDCEGVNMSAGEFRAAPRMLQALVAAVDSEVVNVIVEMIESTGKRQVRITKPHQPGYAALQALIGG